jgi:chromate reductase, NAD(P)H dehydrogenase (quinone)
MTTIAVLVGSLHKESINKKVAQTLEHLAPKDVTFKYIDINMPLYDQDLEANFPAEAQAAKDIIEAADAVLFVSPEYNRSVPGVLKNAIDWISRPWGANSFVKKPVGVVGASIGPVGTAVMQSDMHHILAFLETEQFTQPEVYIGNVTGDMFDEDGQMIDERWRKNLEAYITSFSEWAKK